MFRGGGFLELISTFSGWRLYDSLWQLRVDTGLACPPFAALIFTGLRNAAEQTSSDVAGVAPLPMIEGGAVTAPPASA